MKTGFLCGFTFGMLLFGAAGWAGDVRGATVTGVIGPASAHFIAQGIDRAEQEKANGFLLELDTPKGLSDSLRQIVQRFLAAVAHPNSAYILFMVGLLGLYFELSNPGAIFPGVTGAISLILAFYAFQALPVNYAGVLLIVLSVILFIIDVMAATHGALTAGGMIAMFMGSVMLFNGPEPELRLSLQVIIPVVLVIGGFFVAGTWLSLKSQFRKPVSGAAGLIGQEGDARSLVNRNDGTVFVAGTHWNAVADTEIPAGRRVKVTAVIGMVLTVVEVKDAGSP